jgi:dipeptidyl aminopeptidase/acylaminoacyl peptidase
VSAVFNIFGPTDMRRDYPASLDGMFELVLGQRKAEAAETLRLASPVDWITKDDAPVFTLHGEKDPLVPVAQARWLKENLDKAGVRNEMVIVPAMVHSINVQDQVQMKAIADGTAWLKKMLAPAVEIR